MVTILSDDSKQEVGHKLYEEFLQNQIEVEYVNVAEADVKPCYGCGGCTYKSFGKCVIRDDMDIICPKLIRTDYTIMVTPIVWGSYSYHSKKVLDKCAVIGDRYYHVKRGEIVKGIQGHFKLYVIGVKEGCSHEEANAFHNLVKENINIMDTKGSSYIVNPMHCEEHITNIVKEVCQ